MALKRIVVLGALLVAVANAAAVAQERGPLAMRAEFEWTVVGVVAGAAVGALLWLTDPANPNHQLSDSVVSGAAWGSAAGAVLGVFVLQRSVVPPGGGTAALEALAPRNRISADPIAERNGAPFLLAHRDAAQGGGREFRLPLLNLHF